MAAQRLARGHRLVQAAAFAELLPAQLRHLLATDEDFREVALDNRQAIERALADNMADLKYTLGTSILRGYLG